MLQIIKKALHNLTKPEQNKLYALVAGNFIISVLDISSFAALVYIIGVFSGEFTGNQSNFHTFFSENIVLTSCLFISLFILKNLVGIFVYNLQYKFVYGVASRMSKNNLYHYLQGDYEVYSNSDSSVHIRKISHQPIEFCNYVLAGLQQILTECMIAFLAIAAIFFYNPKLFLLLLLVLLPAVLIIAFFTKRKLKAARENVKLKSEKSLQLLQEALSGYVESNVFNKNHYFTERYFRMQSELNNYLSQIQSIHILPSRLMETIAVLGLFTLIASMWFLEDAATINIINIGAFLAASYKIIPSIVKIINLSSQVKTYRYTITNAAPNPYIAIEKNASAAIQAMESIAFKEVSFHYKSNKILKDFNFEIKKGEFIGISGVSGKGKTTIINLLLGFLNPSNGEIWINNLSQNEAERKQYWPQIALVKQKPFVLADSILNNIILDEKEYDQNRLIKAIEFSGLQSLIEASNEGINQQITEHGKNISGGQQQRIVLARAIYKNADLIILDEPFNELDAMAEEDILRNLQDLARQGKMIILISHNKASLAFCHKSISLDA